MDSNIKSEVLKCIEKFVHTIESDGRHILLLGLGGSHAYGTNVEGSDIDIRGICSNTCYEVLGVNADKEQYASSEADAVVYTLRKAIWLIAKCNPAMVEILSCRPEDYLYMSPAGEKLIKNMSLFLSKKAAVTFGGYARSQLNRLVNRSGRAKDLMIENEERSFEKDFLTLTQRYDNKINNPKIERNEDKLYLSFEVTSMPVDNIANLLNEFNSIDRSYRKSVRNDKATAHGKLSKHMMHLIRLYLMGIELMEDGVIHTYRDGDEHELLMAIRNGDYLMDDGLTPTFEFEQLVNHYSTAFDTACERSKIQDEPDMEAINKLVVDLNKDLLEGV